MHRRAGNVVDYLQSLFHAELNFVMSSGFMLHRHYIKQQLFMI